MPRRGLIITNSHIIDQADRITVRLTDGRALQATRIGVDRNTDVAVIRVEATGLTEATFADSDSLEVGDFVLAIGHPLPLGQTVSAGIVSGLHRANVGLSPYEDFIQTDAAIYPGNSGGALVNIAGPAHRHQHRLRGRVERQSGLSASQFPRAWPARSPSASSREATFAAACSALCYEDPAASIVADLRMSAPPPGAVILEVDTGSPAARAGLRPGDLVTGLGGTPVRDAVDLQAADRVARDRRGRRIRRVAKGKHVHAAGCDRRACAYEMSPARPSIAPPTPVSSHPTNGTERLGLGGDQLTAGTGDQIPKAAPG